MAVKLTFKDFWKKCAERILNLIPKIQSEDYISGPRVVISDVLQLDGPLAKFFPISVKCGRRTTAPKTKVPIVIKQTPSLPGLAILQCSNKIF